jgi:uncharacterized iron-regulated membrane protein
VAFLRRYFHRPQQLTFRKLNFQVHLWAGIALTLYLIVIGVSGSILVFRAELERLCGLKLWQGIHAQGQLADIAAVVENLRAAYPRSHIVSVETPNQSNSTFVAILEGRGERIKVACDPTGGKILGEFPTAPSWLDVVAELHEGLLIHRTGRLWNGAGAVCLLLLNATGMVIWWPGIRNWKRALKVDPRRSWRRINFDLHSAAGFWTILIVSFWALSGIYFAWPRQVFLFVNSISPVITARPPVITISPESGASAPGLAALVEMARRVDPGTQLSGISFPYNRRTPIAILMRRRDTPGREYMDTVYLNPYTGQYISTWRYGVNQSLGDWIVWSQVPLHFGTYWGWTVKLIWALAGLAIPLLALTGLVLYWNRVLRRKWKRLRRPNPAAAAVLHNLLFFV